MNDIKKDTSIIIGIIILFIVCCEAIAQCCIKHCNLTKKIEFYILGVFFYSLVCYGLYNLYAYKDMGIINLIWSCLSIITIIVVGIVFFHETINIYDIIGIILCIIGLFFIFVAGH